MSIYDMAILWLFMNLMRGHYVTEDVELELQLCIYRQMLNIAIQCFVQSARVHSMKNKYVLVNIQNTRKLFS